MKIKLFHRKEKRDIEQEIAKLQEECRIASERMEKAYLERQRLIQQYEENTETLARLQKEIEKILETKTFS